MREVFTRETLTEAKVRKMVLREAAPFAVNAGSTGVTAWALRHNIAKGHLSSFMDGKRGPGTDVLNALDLEWRICRKRAASAIEARRAETHSGSVHESAVAESETPDRPSHWSRNLPGVR